MGYRLMGLALTAGRLGATRDTGGWFVLGRTLIFVRMTDVPEVGIGQSAKSLVEGCSEAGVLCLRRGEKQAVG